MRPLTLLCGMPRSGTTWLGKIFDSHPDTLYRHEPDSVRRIDGLPIVADSGRTQEYRCAVESFVAGLADMRQPKVAASLPVFRKSYHSALQYGIARAAAVAAKGAERMLEDVAVPVLTDYERVPQLHVVWKSIELVGAMGAVLRIMPSARGILILRHPCGYVASVVRGESKGKFDGETTSADDFGIFDMLLQTSAAKSRGLTWEMLSEADPFERMAWRWILFNEKAVDDLKDVQGSTQVFYEDLCLDPIAESKRLLSFAGLSWASPVEDFIRESNSSEQAGYYSLFKDPLKSANKWRQELTPVQIDRVMKVVAQSPVGLRYLERE